MRNIHLHIILCVKMCVYMYFPHTIFKLTLYPITNVQGNGNGGMLYYQALAVSLKL